MTTPLTFERRIELVERDSRRLADLIEAQARVPQGQGKRWNYWAVTAEATPSPYPGNDGNNTFPIVFVDPTYTPTQGTQVLLAQPRSSLPETVARTTNGQWCLPDEFCMASPLPPPPGTTDKGRWLITPLKTYYYGFLNAPLTRLGSAAASVYKHGPAGTWTDTLFDQTVWDSGFLAAGDVLPAGTWVRFEWERVAWVVSFAWRSQATAIATLRYDMCGTTADIENFQLLSGGTHPSPPTTANNTYFRHRGMAGDYVLLEFSAFHNAWLVTNVRKHAYQVVTDLRQVGDCENWCVEGKVVIAALEVCAVPAWDTLYCNPCVPINQTSGQTSFPTVPPASTSVPAHNCCGLAVTGGLPTGSDPLYATLSEAVAPCNENQEITGYGGSYLRSRQNRTGDINPISNPSPFTVDGQVDPNASGPIQMFTAISVETGADLGVQNIYENWKITCERIRDPLTGNLLFPADDTRVEWVVRGSYFRPPVGNGASAAGNIEIREYSQQGVWYYSAVNPQRFQLATATINVYGCTPFHAIATFRVVPPENYTFGYPWTGFDCGVTTLEFTE